MLGKQIRRRRQELNMTLEELADKSQIDEKHLGRIERGEKLPNAFTLTSLQSALKLSSDVYMPEFEELCKKYSQEE